MKQAISYSLTFLIGAVTYYLIEVVYRSLLDRGEAHWTMLVIGGFSVLAIRLIDDFYEFPLLYKALLSGVAITAMEFVLGSFYFYILHDPIWTYGTAQIMEVISLTWSLLWCALSLLALLIRRGFRRFLEHYRLKG